MFITLLWKEIREQMKTGKFWILAAVLFVCGMISPLLAKYTPVILRSVPGLPEGLAGSIPDPTVVDSISQYLKNMTQFGVLLVILFNMGLLAQEKERGTLGMLLTKPVSRAGILLAKWGAAALAVVVGVAAAAAAQYLYNYFLFNGGIEITGFLGLNLLLILFFIVYLTAALFASAFSRTQGIAAILSFGLLAILLIVGSIPRISDVMPGAMLNWGAASSLGAPAEFAWGGLLGSSVLIGLFLLGAWIKFEKEEI